MDLRAVENQRDWLWRMRASGCSGCLGALRARTGSSAARCWPTWATCASRAFRPLDKAALECVSHHQMEVQLFVTHFRLLACLATRLCQCIMPGIGGMMRVWRFQNQSREGVVVGREQDEVQVTPKWEIEGLEHCGSGGDIDQRRHVAGG